MLSSYPICFNTTELEFFPATWEESLEVVENVFSTEAGTDVVDIVRTGKLTVNVGCRQTAAWAKTFKQFSALSSFTLKIYDPLTEAYAEHTVRMRDFRSALVKGTDRMSVSEGLWDISFTLKEF